MYSSWTPAAPADAADAPQMLPPRTSTALDHQHGTLVTFRIDRFLADMDVQRNKKVQHDGKHTQIGKEQCVSGISQVIRRVSAIFTDRPERQPFRAATDTELTASSCGNTPRSAQKSEDHQENTDQQKQCVVPEQFPEQRIPDTLIEGNGPEMPSSIDRLYLNDYLFSAVCTDQRQIHPVAACTAHRIDASRSGHTHAFPGCRLSCWR